MLMNNELNQIRCQEQAALQRRKMAWEEFVDAGRRFDDAYYLLKLAQEDFCNAKRNLDYGDDAIICFKIAKKRQTSAEEEYQYQKMRHKQVKAEFETAWNEHRRWYNELQRRSAEVKMAEACG